MLCDLRAKLLTDPDGLVGLPAAGLRAEDLMLCGRKLFVVEEPFTVQRGKALGFGVDARPSCWRRRCCSVPQCLLGTVNSVATQDHGAGT